MYRVDPTGRPHVPRVRTSQDCVPDPFSLSFSPFDPFSPFAFVERVRRLLPAEAGEKKLTWVPEVEEGRRRRAAARALAQGQGSPSLAVWLRVTLGNELRTEVA